MKNSCLPLRLLEDAAEAYRYLESNEQFGKIVISVHRERFDEISGFGPTDTQYVQ